MDMDKYADHGGSLMETAKTLYKLYGTVYLEGR